MISLADILNREFFTIDAFDGLCKAERIMNEKKIECLIVTYEGMLSGTLTAMDICRSHPNRIVADAMVKNVITAPPDMPLWDAKLLFEEYGLDELPVVDQGELAGIVTAKELYTELGKHLDQLTGLYRSEYLYYNGMKLLERGLEISIIFIDLDQFGQIDKNYGHVQGDWILKEIARVIENNVSEDTYLCRYGGDEFAVLAPYMLEKSKCVAEKIIKAISSHIFPSGLNITASIGIAGGRRHEPRTADSYLMISRLINLASLASTKAKRETNKLSISNELFSSEIA